MEAMESQKKGVVVGNRWNGLEGCRPGKIEEEE
jgi:hypothetical protein